MKQAGRLAVEKEIPLCEVGEAIYQRLLDKWYYAGASMLHRPDLVRSLRTILKEVLDEAAR